MERPHYVRFAKALAFVGTALMAGCAPSTGTGCVREGMPCTIGAPAAEIPACCICRANTDAGTDATTGTFTNAGCIGPLPPPELFA